ncbi:MAG: hypothetical protein WCJ30_14110 [Deltaproteobacteria bacterium]
MNLCPALLAIALVSLPSAAQAQDTPTPGAAGSTVAAGLSQVAPLTRAGLHATPEGAVADGLELVDTQRVDVDGDGDLDVLGFVDLRQDADDDKPDLGRGVAVFFREGRGWRGETVASVGRFPVEAGFNWGQVERLRAGATPLLHVQYSEARPGGATTQADTVVRFDRGAVRTVFTSQVGRTAQRVSVRASDVDGDGTSELLEVVATERHCDQSSCVAATEARRVFRWNDALGQFVSGEATGAVASGRTQRGRTDTVAVAGGSR